MKKILSIGLVTAVALTSVLAAPIGVLAGETAVEREDFGRQLSAGTYEALFYDEFVSNYVYQDGEAGNTDNDYTGLAQPLENSGIIEIKNIKSEPINVKGKDAAAVVNAQAQKISDEYSEDIRAAFDAFIKDYPEVFWLNKVDYKFKFSALISNDTVTVKTTVTITPVAYANGMVNDIKAFNDAVLNAEDVIANSYDINNTSELVTGIYAYIANSIEYNYGVKEGKNYTALPVFVDKYGNLGVCECYSKAMKILLDRYGVDNVLIIGSFVDVEGNSESHMWNNVEVDGNWYLVDATLGDQAAGLYFNYILAGNNTLGYGSLVKNDHVPTNYFSSYSDSKKFTLPQLANEAYELVKVDGIQYNYADANTREIKVVTDDNKAASKSATVKKTVNNTTTTNGKAQNKTVAKKATKVAKVKIAKAKFSKVKAQKYKKGKAIKPAVTVKYNNKKLVKGKDYTIKYKNNKKKGTATITIVGIGNFKGTKTIKFKIK